jgi:hypothetical protein
MDNRRLQHDDIAARIEAFDEADRRGVDNDKDAGAYHFSLLTSKAPIVQLKPTANGGEVRLGCWSHRRKWENVDDKGRIVMPSATRSSS